MFSVGHMSSKSTFGANYMERVAQEQLKQSAECPIHRHINSVNRCVKRL